MVHAARALGLGCMLGCMIESGLGIAAGAHIASLFDHVDLDGNILLARRPVAGRRVRRRRAAARRAAGSRRLAGMSATRYLILAEGFSGDPHYGKTMRGVLRYRRDDVVAILDSTRAPGDTEDGVPVVQTVDDALRFEPNTALVGVATQGGRFPPAWIDLLKQCIAARARHRERPARLPRRRRRAARELAAAHGVELRDLRRPPRRPLDRDGREPRTCRGRSCSPSAPTARSGR